MKIVLVTDYFYPFSNGGTEKYVYLLAKNLGTLHTVKILSNHTELTEHHYEGLAIDYILPNGNTNTEVIKGLQPSSNIEQFKAYIDKEQPTIVHFHTLTTNFSHFHISYCFKKNIKTFFTSHIPGDLCPRGDFMYKGKSVCDGKIEKSKCLHCLTNSNGSMIRNYIKYFYHSFTQDNPINIRLTHLQEIYRHTHKIIVVCNWQKEFFIKNGISANHLALCRQAPENERVQKTPADNIRLGFLGRISPVKGLHLLLDALEKNDSEFSLKIAAIKPSIAEKKYFKQLKEQSKSINNCSWSFNITSKQLDHFFENIDYLIVPSLWLETGPFVIYEALASGTPVLATNFGGQAELIEHGINGFLFEPNKLALKNLLNSLKIEHKINPSPGIRKAENIAQEMLNIYN